MMTRIRILEKFCRVGFRLALLGVLTASAAGLPGRAFAQSAQVEGASFGSAGGWMQGGGVSLFSSVGTTFAGDEMEGASFELASGVLGMLPARPALSVAHVPPPPQPAQSPVVLEAQVDPEAAGGARLFYRRGGAATFTAVEMDASPEGFAATIPAAAVTEQGLTYYLIVTDLSGGSVRIPAADVFSVRVSVPEPGISVDPGLPGGSEQTAYRIVSFPLDIGDKRPAAVLADDLGPYDDTRWRFFAMGTGESLIEYPAIQSLQPGEGFWIVTREGGRPMDTGAGLTAELDRPFGIVLRPGWNLVGTPFSFELPVRNIRMASGQSFLLRSFEGHWNDPLGEAVTAMRPFEGYAVFNNFQILDTLLIDPDPAAISRPAAKHVSDPHFQPVWGIRILAQSGAARDVDNLAAVATEARGDWDVFDQPEPPVLGGFVSLYFTHPEWGMPSARFSTDARPVPGTGEAWDFEVRTDLEEPVRLRFEGMDDVPPAMDVWLEDVLLRQAQDLRVSDTYTLAVADPTEPRRLRLVVGPAAFVEEHLDRTPAGSGSDQRLSSFPNPFRTSTTIQYSLSEPAAVTLEVYNLLGEQVVVLVQEDWQEEGSHVRVWDGHNVRGERVPSGLYFLHLDAGGRTRTRPVVLVR